MKKVLVVEDTMENMEAAKAFFSTVEGFEFIFAMDREQAQKLLPEVDVLITDRRIPFNEEIDFPGANPPKDESHNDTEYNGFFLTASAIYKKLPVIMAAEHGNLMLFIPKNQSEEVIEVLGGFLRFLETKEEIKKLRWEDQNIFETFCRNILLEYLHRQRISIKKNSPDAWKLVWEKLKEQF